MQVVPSLRRSRPKALCANPPSEKCWDVRMPLACVDLEGGARQSNRTVRQKKIGTNIYKGLLFRLDETSENDKFMRKEPKNCRTEAKLLHVGSIHVIC